MHNTGMLHHNDIMQNIDDGYAADESDAFSLHTPTNTYIDNFILPEQCIPRRKIY